MGRSDARQDPAKAGKAPATSHRSVLALVALLLIAFSIAIALQVDTKRRASAELAIGEQTDAAVLLAARADAEISQALGALAAAAETARLTNVWDANAGIVASVAARAPAVRGVSIFDRAGRHIVSTSGVVTPIAAAALQAAGDAQQWSGAPAVRGRPPAPVILRRVEHGAIVSVLDPNLMLADAPASQRALLATSGGEVLHATPALQRAGLAEQRALLAQAPQGAGATGIVREDARGAAWAISVATTSVDGLRVVSSAPTTSTLSMVLAAILQFMLLAGAPITAVAALLLLLNQNQRRVEVAEQEAERAEAHFRLAADSARAGVFEWRSDANVIILSDQAANILHAPSDTLKLPEFLGLSAREDRDDLEEEFRSAKRTGALDLRFRVGAGANVAWVEARGVAIEDRSSAGPVRFIGSVVDVTPRHEAEMRVTRLERQLRAAIDSYSGPFALWDGRKRLMLWNAAYATAFRLDPQLLRPRASYEAIALAAAAQIRRERVHPVDPQVREVELNSGEWLHLVERRTGDGGLVTVGIDITALKRQEEALKRNDKRLRDLVSRLENSEGQIKRLARETEEARQKAEEASEAKSAFLANMSHELRTPLTHIIGFSEIMAKELFGPIANDQYRQYSSDIYSSGNHLLDLINDILDMAKIEAGKFTLTPKPLDPLTAIEQAVRLTRGKADQKKLQLIVDAEGLPEIEADHRAFKQMLINLLSNAIKFTAYGAVMVRGRPTADGIVVRVVDTGCGIPAHELPRLARPFEQVDTELSRNNSGTGLGLALTKSLIELHGGRMTIESEVGRGTIVSVYLPKVFGAASNPERTAAE
ncbi:MAG: PAS domain-containing sensor histidine kinase [Hyphomonadaceae bacterium]|nr:PAS domain-containing sensor histidine kinase [Hyphomonadaceae bacterium]